MAPYLLCLSAMQLLTAPLLVLATSETVLGLNRGSEERTPLHFGHDGTFQISVFEDLHYGEAEDLVWGPQQDVASARVINAILGYESQQLVVLNGDLITGENTYLHNSSHYVDEIVAPLVEHNRLWASTYGNHDSQYNLSRSDILAREQRYKNSLTRQDVDTSTSGVSNYYLPVYSSDTSKRTPELILWFFDSRGGFQYQQEDANGEHIGQPAWVDQTVVDWFTATKAKLRHEHGCDIPSLAFVHIPINAMLAFQKTPGVEPHYEPGINDDVPLDAQGEDTPFMQALLNTPGLMALFSGHDHGDDWCFKWDQKLEGMDLTGNGLDLCFGRHTGYGGYGTWTRGSRQILVREEGLKHREVETWVRLETGVVSGQVTLNGTYGGDWYPEADHSHTSLANPGS